MQFLSVKKNKIDIKEFSSRHATESDCELLIDKDTTILVDNIPAIVYIANIGSQIDSLFSVLENIKYDTSTRTSGLVTTSKIFGYSPRNEIRQASCRAASIAYKQPYESEILNKFAAVAGSKYFEVNNQLALRHKQMTEERVVSAFRLKDSMFTSGIVNQNNPLKYHFDSGNYHGVWSAMFALKKGITGGHLACPEFNLSLKCQHGSLTFFDGQSILHGVTPIIKNNKDAKRYTVVYYSLRKMWSCEEPKKEIERMRISRMKTETRRMTK